MSNDNTPETADAEPAVGGPVERMVRPLVELVRELERDHGPGGWPAVEMATLSGLADEIERLRGALRQVAQTHAWLAFGECRSFGSDVPLLCPSDADAVARVALGEYCEGPNV